jgi:hypothetical protein
MQPAEKNTLAYTPPPDLAVQPIKFSLVRGDTEIATARLEQLRLAKGVRQIKVGTHCTACFSCQIPRGAIPAYLCSVAGRAALP